MESNEIIRHLAAAASTAMRDFAHASVAIDDPADLYPLTGEVLHSLRSLVRIADHLAHAHMRHRGQALGDGNAVLGAHDADGATWALVRARELLDAAESAVDLAAQDDARVAWRAAEPSERWISVVFLQGEEATEALDLLDRSGAPATIRHLAQWDFGDETTESALANGYVYERIPSSPTDRTAEDSASGYALIHNPTFGYVSLLRRFPRGPDEADTLVERAHAPSARPPESVPPAWSAPHSRLGAAAARSVAW